MATTPRTPSDESAQGDLEDRLLSRVLTELEEHVLECLSCAAYVEHYRETRRSTAARRAMPDHIQARLRRALQEFLEGSTS